MKNCQPVRWLLWARRAVVAVVFVAVGSWSASSMADASDGKLVLTPSEAIAQIQAANPELVATTAPSGLRDIQLAPALVAADGQLDASGTMAPAAISTSADAGYSLSTGGVDNQPSLLIAPAVTDAGATEARVVNGSAVVFADTAAATDTVVRPTAAGLETFEQIRDASAPTSYGWRLSLSPGETLQKLSTGGVAVVSSAPVLAASDVDHPTPSDSAPASQTGALVVEGGLVAGQDPATDQVLPNGNAQSPGAASPDGSPDAPDVEPSAFARPSTGSTGTAYDELKRGQDLLEQAQSEVDGDVLAVVAAPSTLDAEGRIVPTRLDVTGPSTVTMTVDHTSFPYTYPLAADPEFASAAASRCHAYAYPPAAHGVAPNGSFFVSGNGGIQCDYSTGKEPTEIQQTTALEGYYYSRRNYLTQYSHTCGHDNHCHIVGEDYIPNNVPCRVGSAPFDFYTGSSGQYEPKGSTSFVRVPFVSSDRSQDLSGTQVHYGRC